VRRVVVSVRREDEAHGRDLEIPAEVPASELTSLLGSALGWRVDEGRPLHIRIEPSGRLLRDDESLDAAGVVDGARLVFTPALDRVAPPTEVPGAPVEQELPPARPPEGRGPFGRWLWPVLAALCVLATIVGVGLWAARDQRVPDLPFIGRPATPTLNVQPPTPLVLTLGPEPTSAPGAGR
jgi:uncharacterized ubiquitin-like protein YukD